MKNITFIKTKSSKDTYSKICCNFFNNPSTKLNLIGVTGTNGKTSSTTLLYEMFSLNNILSGLISIVVGAGAAWFGLYTNSHKKT